MSKKYSLLFFKKIAKSHNGKCLSLKYYSYDDPLIFKCKNGHIWESYPRQIVHKNSWCKQCYIESIRCTIKECKNLAKSKNGKCLSKQYKNQNTNMQWECQKNHKWNATYSSIKRGNWCKKCYYNSLKKSLQNCIDHASQIQIKCLSKRYINSSTPMKWKCMKCSHIWKTSFNCIRQSDSTHGCPKCAENTNRKGNNLNICKKLATNNNGYCLSKKYKNQYTRMSWQCQYGHEWMTTLKQIKRGQWCPDCHKKNKINKGEEITRKFIEKKFNAKFSSQFPKWLINPSTGRKMEIDGFNQRLGIGVEYQGFQHFNYHNFIHKSKLNFKKLKKRDKVKKKIFKEKGLILLIIKEFDIRQPLINIHSYLNKVINKQLKLISD